MIYLLTILALSGAPKLIAPLTTQEKDGTWKCSGFCLTGGNDDGGYCRTPLHSRRHPTEDACKAALTTQCEKTKPPPGGCRWAGSPPAAK